MTIDDIAKLAGVSRSTVSRVINQQIAAEKTKEKVLRIIEENEYYPNSYAQYLGRKTKTKIPRRAKKSGSAPTKHIKKALKK